MITSIKKIEKLRAGKFKLKLSSNILAIPCEELESLVENIK
jgi:hypothetical protein